MPRPRNPLSKRNRSATFTGAEVAKAVERLGATKRARVVRERGEFGDLRSIIRAPYIPPAAYSWSIADIVAARDQQMTGRFRQAARLAESMNTDDAIFTARQVRLAPLQGVDVKVCAGRGPRADSIASEAEALFGTKGIAFSKATENTIRRHLVDHGVAFASINWRPREDGSRWDMVIEAWPIEFVWYNPMTDLYHTQLRRYEEDPPDPASGQLYVPPMPAPTIPFEPIIHGNGRWIVFKKSERLAHREDAAVLPSSLVWARHAFANRDWAKGSATHGNAKVIGELPEGVAMTDEEGELTQEAAAFLQLISAVASQDQPVGIRPKGSTIDYMVNGSKAWEVWAQLSESAERAAARVYLGTDGVLGAQGGAPGVDVSALFGVHTVKVQSDIECIQNALQSGAICPWAAVNFGDDRQAPSREYVFPDPDEAEVRKDFSDRNAAFLAALKAAKDAGYQLTPEYTKELAARYAVPVPSLPAPAGQDATPAVAPTPPAG